MAITLPWCFCNYLVTLWPNKRALTIGKNECCCDFKCCFCTVWIFLNSPWRLGLKSKLWLRRRKESLILRLRCRWRASSKFRKYVVIVRKTLWSNIIHTCYYDHQTFRQGYFTGGVGLTPCSSTEGEKEKWEEEKEMLAQLGNSLRVLVDDFQWLP